MIPVAASKQAPEIRACFRSSGLGASPSLPFGSDPITLKYLHGQKTPIWLPNFNFRVANILKSNPCGVPFLLKSSCTITGNQPGVVISNL
jgi:hypothetical protein